MKRLPIFGTLRLVIVTFVRMLPLLLLSGLVVFGVQQGLRELEQLIVPDVPRWKRYDPRDPLTYYEVVRHFSPLGHVVATVYAGFIALAVAENVRLSRDGVGAVISRLRPRLATLGRLALVWWILGEARIAAFVASILLFDGWLMTPTFLAVAVISAYVGIYLCVSGPVAAVETTGAVGALRRSWRLVRGHSWQVFALSAILPFLASFILGVDLLISDLDALRILSAVYTYSAIAVVPLEAVIPVVIYLQLRRLEEERAGLLQEEAAAPASS